MQMVLPIAINFRLGYADDYPTEREWSIHPFTVPGLALTINTGTKLTSYNPLPGGITTVDTVATRWPRIPVTPWCSDNVGHGSLLYVLRAERCLREVSDLEVGLHVRTAPWSHGGLLIGRVWLLRNYWLYYLIKDH